MEEADEKHTKAVRDMIKAGMLETREELQFYRYGVVLILHKRIALRKITLN